MKITREQLLKFIPELTWDEEEIATKLSLIGHESVVVGNTIEITLTPNRKDCQNIENLCRDFAGIYGLKTNLPDPTTSNEAITVKPDQITKLLGTHITPDQIASLNKLGFKIEGISVFPPSYRTDVTMIADIAEEIARIIGFNNLPDQVLDTLKIAPKIKYLKQRSIKTNLITLGFTESLGYSFSSKGSIKLKNPHNENEKYLRSSLQVGLLRSIARNPYLKRCRFFEIEHIFSETDETTVLGLILTGIKESALPVVAESLEQALGSKLNFKIISKDILDAYDIKQANVWYGEIDIAQLNPKSTKSLLPKLHPIKPLSKYPPLVRDITCSARIDQVPQIFSKLKNAFPDLLICDFIDSYQKPDQQLPSLTFRLIFQKMESSFLSEDIAVIDTKLQEYFLGEI